MKGDPRNLNSRLDKRPNLAKAGDPGQQDFGTASKTQYAKEAPTGPAYGYDQSKPGTMQFGQSSSFKTSTGLVNMLDVTKGVTEISGKAVQAQETLDKNKAARLAQELQDKQAEEGWELKNPAEQFNDMRKIQDGYKDGWYSARGRTDFRAAQNSLKFKSQAHDLEAGLLLTTTETAEAYAAGDDDPGKIWKRAEERYNELLSTHGRDPIKATRIKQAMQEQRAVSEAARAQTINTTIGRMIADESFQGELLMMRPDMGYDEWRKTVMGMAMERGGEGFRMALGAEYNEDDDSFEGPWSDGMNKRIDAMLEEQYREKLSIEKAAEARNSGVAAQTLGLEVGADFTVNELTSGDPAVSGSAQGNVIDNVNLSMAAYGRTTQDTSKRRTWLLSEAGKFVPTQLSNHADPEAIADTLQKRWTEIIATPEFQDNLFAFLEIPEGDEAAKSEAVRQYAAVVGDSFKVYKDSRRSTANANGQGTKKAWHMTPPGPQTDAKKVNEGIEKSLLNRARTEATVPLLAAPVDEEAFGNWSATWITTAAEAAFARSVTDPNYTAEQAFEFKIGLAEAFKDVSSVEEAKAAVEALAIKMKAEVFTEDFPFELTRSAGEGGEQKGDWSIRVREGYTPDVTTTALASVMSHMSSREVEGRMVFDVKDLKGGVYQSLWTKMADRYVQAMAQPDLDITGLTEQLADDTALYYDLFGAAGTEIWADSALNAVFQGPSTVSDNLKAELREAMAQVFANAPEGILSVDDRAQVGKILSAYQTGKGWNVKNDTSKAGYGGRKLGFKGDKNEIDPEFIDLSLGSGVLGARPNRTHRGRETGIWESITDWAFEATGGMVPGKDVDSLAVGKALRQPHNATIFTGIMSQHFAQNPGSRLGSNDQGSPVIDMNFIDDNPWEASQMIGDVMDASGYEFVPSFSEDGEATGGSFEKKEKGVVANPVTGKDQEVQLQSYQGPLSEVFSRTLTPGVDPRHLDNLPGYLANLGGGNESWVGPGTRDSVAIRMADPDFRRTIEQYGYSSQGVLVTDAGRKDLAGRIDAQFAVLTSANEGYSPDTAGWDNLRDFQAELASGELGPVTAEYLDRAREISRRQGIAPKDDGSVGQFFLFAAMAEDAWSISEWPHAPTHFVPNRQVGVGGVGKDYDLSAVRFTVGDSFYVQGSKVNGSMEMPLFAPSLRQDRAIPFNPLYLKQDGRSAERGRVKD